MIRVSSRFFTGARMETYLPGRAFPCGVAIHRSPPPPPGRRLTLVADAPVPGTPHTAGPPSPPGWNLHSLPRAFPWVCINEEEPWKAWMNEHVFNIGKWHGALLSAAGAFESLTELVTTETALRHHTDRRTVISGNHSGIRTIPLKAAALAEHLREGVLNEIAWAHQLYSSQMMVLAASHLESMLDEFFYAAFESAAADDRVSSR